MTRRLQLAALLLTLTCRPAAPRASDTGLWDAHTHLSWYGPAALDSLLAYGVTSVRDCGGDAVQLKQWRDEIAAGKRRGPHIYFAGPQLDGPKTPMTHRVAVLTPAEAVRAVDSLADLGVDFIKTHNAIPRAAYFAVLREARRRGLKVASHLAVGIPAWEAADSGASSLEHAAESIVVSPMYAGYVKDLDGALRWWRTPAGDSAIAHLARTGVAVTPTLVAYHYWIADSRSPAESIGRTRVYELQEELTLRLHRAGVPILVGSDFAETTWGPHPGKGVLEEMDLLVHAGLTRQEALAAATTNPRKWMTGR